MSEACDILRTPVNCQDTPNLMLSQQKKKKKETSTDPKIVDVGRMGENGTAVSWDTGKELLSLSRKTWLKDLREAREACNRKGLSIIYRLSGYGKR